MSPATGVRAVVRSLARSPAYATGVVLTLGLGVGVTAAALSVVRSIFLAPLPHDDGEALVYLRHSAPGGDIDNALFSVPEIDEIRRGVPAFGDVAEFSSMRFTVLGMDRPRQVRAGVVTANYFEVLGLEALEGRVIGPGDAGETADPVMVLTTSFWQRAFGGDPGVIGRAVDVDGRSATIVGVAEPHPPYPERTDVYVNMVTSPHHLSATMSHGWDHRMTEAFGRLVPGATVDQARVQVREVAARVRGDHPEAYDDRLAYTVTARPLADQLTWRARSVRWLLLGTAGALLLVALTNVANLMLARGLQLRGELAVRASLGASSSDLRARLVVENLVLGAAGGVVAAGVAAVSLELMASYASRFTVRAEAVGAGAELVGLAAVLALGFAVALAWIPRTGHGAPGRALLGRGSGGGPGTGRLRTQRVLVSAQVAATLVLVTGAVLLARTLVNLQAVNPGVDTAGVVAAEVPPVADGRSPAEVRDDYVAMVRALEARPGVERAALTNVVPFRTDQSLFTWNFGFRLDGADAPEGARPYRADLRTVSSGYFETLGVPVVEGRGLRPSDDDAAPLVAVVNEAFVRTWLDGRDPVGRRVAWTGDVVEYGGFRGDDRTIVGVVADIRDDGGPSDASPAIYMPHLQEPWGTALVVRGAGVSRTTGGEGARGGAPGASLRSDGRRNGGESALAGVLSETVRSVVSNQPVENVVALEEARLATLGDSRLNAGLVGALAFMALLVAGVGIFAVLAFSVGRRMHEMGIRMALGADGRRIVGAVLVEALALVGGGLAVGVAGSWLLAEGMRGLLWGVAPGDPVTLLTGPAVLLGVALTAAALPGLRAARVQPARVLGEGA